MIRLLRCFKTIRRNVESLYLYARKLFSKICEILIDDFINRSRFRFCFIKISLNTCLSFCEEFFLVDLSLSFLSSILRYRDAKIIKIKSVIICIAWYKIKKKLKKIKESAHTTNYRCDVPRVNLVYGKVWQMPGKCD